LAAEGSQQKTPERSIQLRDEKQEQNATNRFTIRN